jgi:hypothetical protein
MRLLYRGIPYEVPTHNLLAPSAADLDNTAQPTVRLMYRGLSYAYPPQPKLASAVIPDDAPMVTLMYRGQTYQRKCLFTKSYQQSRALNWRWQHQTPQSQA